MQKVPVGIDVPQGLHFDMSTCRKVTYLKKIFNRYSYLNVHSSIQDLIRSEESYLSSDPDIYSLEDLIMIRTGELKNKLKYIVEVCCRHTSECEVRYCIFIESMCINRIVCL